jgi:multisubunit Na+/H+ antiporter MnhF subunit
MRGNPAQWLLPAIGYTVLAIFPLALLVRWRGPRILLNIVAFAGLNGGIILLLIEFLSAVTHDFRLNVPRLIAGIVGVAGGVIAARASGAGDQFDRVVTGLTIASGFWLLWWGYLAADMWRWTLGL